MRAAHPAAREASASRTSGAARTPGAVRTAGATRMPGAVPARRAPPPPGTMAPHGRTVRLAGGFPIFNLGGMNGMSFSVVLTQVIILFVLMALGYALAKGGVLHGDGVSQITWLLCYIVSPCIIFAAFAMDYTAALMRGFLVVAASCVCVNLGAIGVGRLLFNRKTVPQEQERTVLQFATIFTNSGFMGFPLLQGIAGTMGLFYGAAYNAAYNLFCWSYGLMLYRGGVNWRAFAKSLLNPNIIATLLGVLCFRFSIRLPGPLNTAVQDIATLNTPLSMIIVGTSLAEVPLRTMFTGASAWFMVLLRNLALPLAALFLLHAAGVHGLALLCSVILVACPVAGVCVIFARLTGRDTELPARLVALTTLFSLVTLPFIAAIIQALRY